MTKVSTFKIGEVVGFKCDIEQYGMIVAIKGDLLTLDAGNGHFIGEYIHGQKRTVVHVSDVWKD